MSDTHPKCPVCGSPLPPDGETCPSCGGNTAGLTTEGSASPGSTKHPPTLGDFSIIREIGRGGMGVVYEARQESMHRNIALKILDAGAVPSPTTQTRFEREAWIGGRLSHPNIVKVHSQGVDGRCHYIAMELAGGESLSDLIRDAQERRREARSDSAWRSEHIRKVVELFVGAADALRYVHESSVVHRDIKPGNLLLSADGSRLMITDFGLARDEESSKLTRKGDFLGTIRYMSPEQLLAGRVRVNEKSDIWSLGISLYEALTLKLPFSGDSEEAYISALSTRDPAPARSQDPAVPRDLETILIKCLERDPERRYQSAADLRDDLERFLQGSPIRAQRPALFGRAIRLAARRRTLLAATGVAVLLAAVAVYVVVGSIQRRRDIERIDWTLTQAIKTGDSPRDIQLDWLRLESLLRSLTRRDPNGALARLALLARARTDLSIPRFGLVSERVPVSVNIPWDPVPGVDFLYTADLEWCWDGSDWRPVASVLSHNGGGSYGSSEWVDQLVDESVMTPGPHHVEARASVRFYEPEVALIESLTKIGTRRIAFGDQTSAWPMVRERGILFTRSLALPSQSINLYEEYPDNFPYRVTGPAAADSALAALRIEVLRATRLGVPEAEGSVIRVGSEHHSETLSWRVSEPSIRDVGHVFEFWAEGWVDGESELPLATWATLEVPGRQDPLLKFGLISGLGRIGVVGVESYPSRFVYWSGRRHSVGAESRHGDETVLEDLGLLTIAESDLPDGAYRANLRLVPDREIALSTYLYDRYFGEELVIPVEFEITTSTGEWVSPEQTGSAPRVDASGAELTGE